MCDPETGAEVCQPSKTLGRYDFYTHYSFYATSKVYVYVYRELEVQRERERRRKRETEIEREEREREREVGGDTQRREKG